MGIVNIECRARGLRAADGLDMLLEQAAVQDQPASFKDVMNFGA